MTLSLNIGKLFNDSSSHALVDELRKRTSEEDILNFEEKFNSKNEKNLHIYICRFLKNRSISRGLASRWLITIIENKESKIDALQNKVIERKVNNDFFDALNKYDVGELSEAGPAGCDSDKCLLPLAKPKD